jgi:hypothetical protein
MRWPDYHCLDAVIDQDHVGYDHNGTRCQLVTVVMSDDTMMLDPAVGVLTAEEARELAFELLERAEHAERLTLQLRSGR